MSLKETLLKGKDFYENNDIGNIMYSLQEVKEQLNIGHEALNEALRMSSIKYSWKGKTKSITSDDFKNLSNYIEEYKQKCGTRYWLIALNYGDVRSVYNLCTELGIGRKSFAKTAETLGCNIIKTKKVDLISSSDADKVKEYLNAKTTKEEKPIQDEVSESPVDFSRFRLKNAQTGFFENDKTEVEIKRGLEKELSELKENLKLSKKKAQDLNRKSYEQYNEITFLVRKIEEYKEKESSLLKKNEEIRELKFANKSLIKRNNLLSSEINKSNSELEELKLLKESLSVVMNIISR